MTDVTQVDQVGLPLELTQSGVSVGFGSGTSFGQLATELIWDNYGKLVVNSTFNGRGIVSRIVSPKNGLNWGFPQDWFYNSTYNAADSPNPPNRGYIGYILQQYMTTPQLYSLYGTNSTATPTTNDYYCAQSDGSASFTFVEIGSSTTCTASTTAMPGGNTYTMQAYNTVEAWISGSSCQSAIFSMPSGGPGRPACRQQRVLLVEGPRDRNCAGNRLAGGIVRTSGKHMANRGPFHLTYAAAV